MKIYVGNLPFTATEDEVRQLFEVHGPVSSVSLISDRDTGRPRGFGFVEMDQDEGTAAVTALDGKTFGGRTLRINEARPRNEGGGGGGGRGGGRGGGGGGGWGGSGGASGGWERY
jgi:RNA recognition motif-containing protein